MAIKLNWDALGIATSIACAIHCAVLPVLISTLPFLGINILHNAFFEWGMITVACIVGVLSLRHGYMKHHRSLTPIYIFLTGFIFLVLKQFFPVMEFWFLAVAVCGIVTAHFYNYRLCHKTSSHKETLCP